MLEQQETRTGAAGYQRIENYGIIGDLRTVALVGMDGSIDWYCYPHFDSPSVFAAILDDEKGGRFKLAPIGEGIVRKQLYWPDTNVLVNRFYSHDGVGQVMDTMPLLASTEEHRHQLLRRVSVIRGVMTFRLQCQPAFDYARADHTVAIQPEGASFHSDKLSLGLASSVPLQALDGSVVAEFSLKEGESATFVLREIEAGAGPGPVYSTAETQELFDQTIAYWRDWLSQCTYTGRWREMVHRSALAIKLLQFAPTGAIVAAPTCSHRYTWVRDASFTVYALMLIGFTDEAVAFGRWLLSRAQEPNPDGSLQIMYGIDGRHTLTEETLDHLEGYRGSRPVRIGNGAYDQLQLDIYGELMEGVYAYEEFGGRIAYDGWTHLRKLIDWVCENWRREDEGIWETRGGRQHFVYSKLMSWVALDRGLRIAEKRSLPADRVRWAAVRDEIFEEIMDRGWNEQRQAFVQHYDSDHLDASNLLLPLVSFVSPTDPRMLSTLDAINRPPHAGGLVSSGLVYRYDVERSADGLAGEEGSFSICTFWLVEALTRAGRIEQARLMFEQMLSYANHLGLYAEEIGSTGEALGNFPQAFTHLALIRAAVDLDRALGASPRGGGLK
jgi:GH15 family glucan-1,4-alpha-glucosidase